jgi:hypothetical protein
MKFTRDAALALLIFTVVFAAHWLSGNTATFDSALSLQTAMSLVREGNTDLDEYREIVSTTWLSTEEIDGHVYMLYPIGPSILAVPLVFTLDRLSPQFNESLQRGFGEPVQTLIACLVVALTATLIFRVARYYVRRPYALLIVLAFAFGTSAWSTASRTLWQHGPSMLMLTIALLLVLRARSDPPWIQFVSLPLALAYVIRPTNSVAIVCFSLFVLLYYRRYFVRYLVWALPVAIPFMLLNLAVYHGILPNYYRWYSGFSLDTFFQALLGQLVSPSRGLLIFSPILWLALAGLIIKARRREFERHDPFVLAVMVLHWIAISLWWNWWGGAAYGPRLFADMLPYFAYWLIPTAGALERAQGAKKFAQGAAWAGLLGLSVFIHYRGANVPEVIDWNGQPAAIDFNSFRVWDWRDPQWLRGITFDPPVDLAVSGLPYEQVIDPHIEARVGSRNVQGRQFDVTSSLIAPPGEAWYAMAENQTTAPEFAAWFAQAQSMGEGHTIAENPPYHLYRFNLAERVQQAARQSEQATLDSHLPVKFGETAELMGYNLAKDAEPSQGLTLVTYWRASERVQSSLKLFVHALDADESIVGQDDRLDVPAELWHTGDWIVQINRVALPPGASPVTIAIGLYNPETNIRLPIDLNGQTTDRLLLKHIDLK